MAEIEPPAILRLRVEAPHALRADLVGGAIVRLDAAFGSHRRRRVRGQPRVWLRLHHLEIGSVVADFIALADAIHTAWEQRELLGGFVAQLSDALQVLSGARPGKVTNADRLTIETLAAPVAHDQARQVTLQVVGDNNTVLIIDAEAVRLIGEQAAAGHVEHMMSEQARVEEAGEMLEREQLAEPGLRSAKSFPRLIRGAFDSEASRRPIHASVMHSGGRWYARPEGMNGVMLPIEDSDRLTQGLDPADKYVAEGSLLRTGGMPSGFVLRRVYDPLT